MTSHLVTEIGQLFAELQQWRALGQEINAYFASHPERNAHYDRWVVAHRRARDAADHGTAPPSRQRRRR